MDEMKNTKRAERRKRTIAKQKKRYEKLKATGAKWYPERIKQKIAKMLRDTPNWKQWAEYHRNKEIKQNDEYRAVNKGEFRHKCMIAINKDIHEDLTLSAQDANPPFHMITKCGGNVVVFTFDPDRDEYVGKMLDSDEIGITCRRSEMKLLKNKDWKELFGRDPFRPYNDMFDAYDYEEYDTEELEREVNPYAFRDKIWESYFDYDDEQMYNELKQMNERNK